MLGYTFCSPLSGSLALQKFESVLRSQIRQRPLRCSASEQCQCATSPRIRSRANDLGDLLFEALRVQVFVCVLFTSPTSR
jgi:hypothetical protein